MLGVIGDILDYSKLEAGGLELDPELFDPAETARSAAAIVADQAAAAGLVRASPSATPCRRWWATHPGCACSTSSNAIKFTRAGAVELELSHRIEADAGYLRIEVRDSGIGVEADHIDQLFVRFTQADASVSRRFGGTGLGLAISKQIVETMGGRIGATSVSARVRPSGSKSSCRWPATGRPASSLTTPTRSANAPCAYWRWRTTRSIAS